VIVPLKVNSVGHVELFGGVTNAVTFVTKNEVGGVQVAVGVSVLGGGACTNPKLKPGTIPQPPIKTGIVVFVVANQPAGVLAFTR
jgi:hypothetical protein